MHALAMAFGATVAGCGGGGGGSGSAEQEGVASVATQVPSSTSVAGLSSGDVSSTSSATVSMSGSAATTIESTAPVDTSTVASASTGTDASTQQVDTSGTQVASASTDQTATPQGTVTRDTAAISTGAATTRSGVGMNLNQISYYSPETPTIDLMKKASPWLTQCQGTVGSCATLVSPARAWDTLEETKLDLDENGWVKSLPAASSTTASYRYATSVVMQGDYQQVGKYVVTYDGSGTLVYGGAMSKSVSESTPGRDVINVVRNGALGYLSIQATNPSNYIRNIRVLPPGGVCANDMTVYAASAAACTSAKGAYTTFDKLPTSVVWHPQFLQDLKGSRALRFMDWGQTNTNLVEAWTKRTQPNNYVWSDITGVPYEAMLDLAGHVGADPWINLPAHVNDDYVLQFAKVAHQKLAAGSVLNVEYGNEMWNYAFPSTKWAFAQAQTAFATQLKAGANPYELEANWYAQRLVNVCKIIKGEFGADASRVKCVANTMAANANNTSLVLNCTYAAPTLGKACGKSLDVVAIAPYFGFYLGTTKIAASMSSWYTDGDGGLGKMFQELLGTDSTGSAVIAPLVALGTGAPAGAVAQAQAWMTSTRAAAAAYGLPMYAYEGGQSLTSGGDAKLQALMLTANRDARMGTAYQQMMQEWRASGGQTFMFFTDVKTSGNSGFWGLKENQFDTAAPKWQVANQWRNTACWWAGC